MSDYNPTDITGQAEAKDKAKARAQVLHELEISDLRWLMSSPRGRRLVWRLLEKSGVWQLSFNPNAMTMAFNEGRRAYGNELFDELMKACPEQFPVMRKEYFDGKRNGNGDPNPK